MVNPEIIGDIEYKVIDSEEDWLLARRYHHDAYVRAPRIPLEPSSTGMIEDPYVESSDYLGAFRVSGTSVGKGGDIVAVLRMIPCSNLGLPALKEYELYPEYISYVNRLNLSRVLELSSFASKGRDISNGLFRLARRYSDARGDTHWFASLHQRTFELFSKYFHFGFSRIGNQSLYMGETAPYVLDLTYQKEFFAHEFPELYMFYYGDTPITVTEALELTS
jgi:hypothetical protein